MVQVVGRIPLLDAALVHHADFVGHGKGLVLVVGNEHRRHAFALENFAHLERQTLAQVHVEVGERLVEQHKLGSRGQRPGQRHPLLLTARKLVGKLASLARQANRRKQVLDPLGTLRRRHIAQPEAHVALNRKMRKQRVVLEHHSNLALLGRHPVTAAAHHGVVDQDFAAGDFLEARDAAQQGCLAATGRAEKTGDAALLQTKIDAIDDGLTAVALNHGPEFEFGHGVDYNSH